MSVLSVTKSNFEEVKKSEKPVLLDFYADWCGPCRMVSPLVDEIAKENPQYLVGKVNVDSEMELAAEFGVESIPMLVVMKNGEIVNKSVGARPKAQILAMLSELENRKRRYGKSIPPCFLIFRVKLLKIINRIKLCIALSDLEVNVGSRNHSGLTEGCNKFALGYLLTYCYIHFTCMCIPSFNSISMANFY